jgi:hypothetical protein
MRSCVLALAAMSMRAGAVAYPRSEAGDKLVGETGTATPLVDIRLPEGQTTLRAANIS